MGEFIDAIKILNDLGFDVISVVFGFLICILYIKRKVILRIIYQRYDMRNDIKKRKSEQYSINVSGNINKCMKSIIDKDNKISNAILCNYHNNITSNANLSYYYFTSITECLGNRVHQCFDIWNEKSYMNYQPELEMMHRYNIFVIDTTNESHIDEFPKLSKLIIDSNAKVGVFISISGINREIGFLLMLYKDDVNISDSDKAEYLYKFNKDIDEISVLMNYSASKQ